RIDRILSGGFGWGLMDKVEAAYGVLSHTYAPGDKIYVFGFSRGAYTARSLAGMIRKNGLPPHFSKHTIKEGVDFYKNHSPETAPKSEAALRFRAQYSPTFYVTDNELKWRKENVPGFDERFCHPLSIEYLGLWDTVGALGLPNHFFISGLFNKKYQFHDTELSKIVKYARHAVAIDEHRQSYEPSLLSNIEELNRGRGFQPGDPDAPYLESWFPGDHGSVGGGGDIIGLSSAPLLWVIEGAQKLRLEFNQAAIADIRAEIDCCAPLLSRGKGGWLSYLMAKKARQGPDSIIYVSDAAKDRWHKPADHLPEGELYRPKTLSKVANQM
ncbi:MAG TPA: DUF2235 domain-containing protein, partial [Micavibrio sp.]